MVRMVKITPKSTEKTLLVVRSVKYSIFIRGLYLPVRKLCWISIIESFLVRIVDLDSLDMSKRIRYWRKLREHLWLRFRREDLWQLSGKPNQNNNYKNVEVGEVVLIGNEDQKMLYWPLDRIIDLIRGRDGRVRVVILKTATGELERAVQRIYPLELFLSYQQSWK